MKIRSARVWRAVGLVDGHGQRERKVDSYKRGLPGSKSGQECNSGAINLSTCPLHYVTIAIVDESMHNHRPHLAEHAFWQIAGMLRRNTLPIEVRRLHAQNFAVLFRSPHRSLGEASTEASAEHQWE